MLNFIFLQANQNLSEGTQAVGEAIQQYGLMKELQISVLNGGPVMISIILLSLVATFIFLERYIAIFRAGRVDSRLMVKLREHILNGKIDSAFSLCRMKNTATSRMIEKGISRIGRSLTDVHLAIENVANLEVSKLEKRLPQPIFTSVFYPKVMRKALKSADAVLGAMPVGMPPSFRISEEMVKKMKPGAVIIDLNMSQGGSFETSRCTDLNNPAFVEHGVVHYCVPNLPAIVARTASIALSNVLIPILISIGEIGGIDNYIKNSKSFRKGV